MTVTPGCLVEGCTEKHEGRGYCAEHYRQWRKHGDPLIRVHRRAQRGSTCSIEGCGAAHMALGYCSGHYTQYRAYGDPLIRKHRKAGSEPPPCSVKGCDKPSLCRGWCELHYGRWKHHGDVQADIPARKAATGCSVEGCGLPYKAKGYCGMHWLRLRKHGDVNYRRIRVKGDGSIMVNGYMTLWMPDHPMAAKNGRILEHRYVMSEVIGRPLLRTEFVHHRNGNRIDNRPSNLELWPSSQPSGQRVEDLVTWAREIIALYGDLVDRMHAMPAVGRTR